MPSKLPSLQKETFRSKGEKVQDGYYTKIAKYFPIGEWAVNTNNYRVVYDDNMMETISKEKMREEVQAYKAVHPEYEIPSGHSTSHPEYQIPRAPSTSRKRNKKRNRKFLSNLADL